MNDGALDLWRRAKSLFADAIDLPAPERDAFVERAGSGDPALIGAVRTLLRQRADATGFLSDLSPGRLAASAEFDALPRTGDVLCGRYELGPRLGAGAFGAVHRAHDRVLRTDVAVKLLAVPDADSAERIRREALALRRAALPGIAVLLDDGAADGVAWMAMRLADGKPFPGVAVPARWDDVAPAAASALEALGRLHWRGIVHNDLKPDNVLVAEGGAVTLVDLGVAFDPEFAGRGPRGATPAFAPPEALAGAAGSAAGDLYSFGAMLFHALSGAIPHGGGTLPDLVRRRASERAPPLSSVAPGAPARVVAAVDALLAIDPAGRPASCADTLALLGLAEPADGPELLRGRAGDEVIEESALRALFGGPDRFFHLREDGARELHRRTGGRAGDVALELNAWSRARLARRERDVFVVTRAALDRLEASDGAPLRLRARPADGALRPGASWAKAYHAFLDEVESDGPGVESAACRVLAAVAGAGRAALALSVIDETFRVLRRRDAAGARVRPELFAALVTVCSDRRETGMLDSALCFLSAYETTPEGRAASDLIRARKLVIAGDAEAALAATVDPVESVSPALERERLVLRAYAASELAGTVRHAAVADLARFARREGSRESRDAFRAALCHWRTTTGRALRLGRAGSDQPVARAQALVSAGVAAIEAHRAADAVRLLAEARAVLSGVRSPGTELSVHALEVYIGVCCRDRMHTDHEALGIVETHFAWHLIGLHVMEAAAAWTRGDRATALELARRFADHPRASANPHNRLLALSLIAAVYGVCEPDFEDELAAFVRDTQDPITALECAALAVPAMTRRGEAVRETARARVAELPAGYREFGGFLDASEVWQRLGFV